MLFYFYLFIYLFFFFFAAGVSILSLHEPGKSIWHETGDHQIFDDSLNESMRSTLYTKKVLIKFLAAF